MARPSQEHKIFAAALDCFAEYGYAATRIRQIAERAGVSEGALYRHYASKEALAQALYAHYLAQFSAMLQQVVESGLPIEQQIKGVVNTILAAYRSESAALHFVLVQQPSFMPNLPTDTCYPIDLITQLITAGQRNGALRAGEPTLLAAMLLGCVLRPIIVSQFAHPGAPDLLATSAHDQLMSIAAWAMLARDEAVER
jgi:AcrR family transcriptional regulator